MPESRAKSLTPGVAAGAIMLGLAALVCRGQTTPTVPGFPETLLTARTPRDVEKLLTDRAGEVNETIFASCRSSAQAQLDKRQFPEALRQLEIALAVATRLGSSVDRAAAYRGIGLAYRGMDQSAAALASYEKGLEAATDAHDRALMAVLLRGIGVASRALGRPREGIAANERSIALYRELGDTHEIAAGLNNLAIDYGDTGDLRHAGELLEESLSLGRAWPDHISRVLSNMGVIATKRGNLSAAVNYWDQTIRSAEEQHQTRDLLISLGNIGNIYETLGQFDKALAMLNRALALARETHNRPIEGATLINRAAVYEAQREPELAIADLKASLRALEDSDASLYSAFALTLLAHLQNARGETAEALPEVERALTIGRQFQSHDVLWQALFTLGECERTRHDRARAKAAFEQSIKEIELLRDLAGGDEQTGQIFLKGKLGPYHALVNAQIEDGQAELAFETAERAKARQLLDTARRGKAELSASMSADERAEEQRLSGALAALDRRLAAAGNSAVRKATEAKWEAAQQQLSAFREHLYSAHPGLAAQRGEAEPMKLAEAADLLPDRRTALVEFTAADDNLYIFVITLGGDSRPVLTTRTVAWSRDERNREITGLQELVAARSWQYRGPAATLYRKLFGPIAAQLAGKNTVVLVPDGQLWDVPFQALIRPDGASVIERQTVFYAPSLTYLRQSRRFRLAPRAPKQLLAIGNPGSANLPNAAREVAELSKLYGRPGACCTLALTGADATKRRWLSEASQYRILHVATHGVLNSNNPMYSWLSLAPANPGRPDDVLEAREVVNLDLRADLAVLSACSTARGEPDSGEGLIGMSWAFLIAGVSTTLVSQWAVDSDSTTQLMLAFHKNLIPVLDSSSGRAGSLRSAALEVRRDAKHRHPYYWAGFVLVGDGY
jgi:CHAT domain-containing protein